MTLSANIEAINALPQVGLVKRIVVAAGVLCTCLLIIGSVSSVRAEELSPRLWEYAELQAFGEDDFLASAYAYDGDFQEAGAPIDATLPGPTRLTVRGRKTISFKFTYYDYFDAEDTEGKATSTTEIEQRLQVQARGEIGRKIRVNIDYDDSASQAEQQQISVRYTGDANEVIQEVALGDIRLALPRSYFVSYDKSLFGARLRARWNDFFLTAIGAVSRGVSEEKTFKGKTTTEKKEISDISYAKRKYFKAFFDQAYPPSKFGNPPFSYDLGSLEVWIDDQNGSNNDDAVLMSVIGKPIGGVSDTYTGYFDKQYAGQDYAMDYSHGVLKVGKSIGEQYVIAVSYLDSSEVRHPSSGYYMLMKGPDERYLEYRLMDYYNLGAQRISQDDFVFQIKDLSDDIVYDWENPEAYPGYQVSIDFDFGIVHIVSSASAGTYYRPFPEAYPPNSLHRYTLYTEYVHSVDVYLLHTDVIPGSEEVYVDDELQVRDEDYIIDYASGYLSFLDSDLIQSDTEIVIRYEYMPVMGGQATVWGGRLEYRPSEVFSMGTTFLSQSASPVGEIPSVGSSPAAHEIWEADVSLNLKGNLGGIWGGDFPASLSLTGEVSESRMNPNTFGAAMVEGFAGTRAETDLPLGEDNWKLGSKPIPVDPDFRDEVIISDEEIPGDTVNPVWSDDDITALVLSYDFTSGMSWDSVVYALSPVGYDYSHMKYLEVWTNELSAGMNVYLDLGVTSENADGDIDAGSGQEYLDTEDANGDGVLNPGEDTGIIMNLPSGDVTIGAGNGRLDTEDLDGDGLLNTTDQVATYGLLDEYKSSLGTGWYKYTIPLEDYLPVSYTHLRAHET